jgi:hypothetical protein
MAVELRWPDNTRSTRSISVLKANNGVKGAAAR